MPSARAASSTLTATQVPTWLPTKLPAWVPTDSTTPRSLPGRPYVLAGVDSGGPGAGREFSRSSLPSSMHASTLEGGESAATEEHHDGLGSEESRITGRNTSVRRQ